MDKNEIKKDLYKSKNKAKFSHYVSGNLYYTIDVLDGTYQFPITTVDDVTLQTGIEPLPPVFALSADLGTTTFFNEMRGSELNRWISKAVDNNEFIRVN